MTYKLRCHHQFKEQGWALNKRLMRQCMNTKLSSRLSDKQVPHCKYIISRAVTKVQQIQKRSFPHIWNFSPKTNLPELKDLEKFTTAELKRFINLQILKPLQILSIWKWKWQESIGEKRNLFSSYKHHRILQLLLLLVQKKFFWAFNIASNFCFLIFVFYKREKYQVP